MNESATGWTPTITSFLAVSMLVLFATACGGSDVAPDPVAKAAVMTQEQGSAKVEVTIVFEPGNGGRAIRTLGSGVVNTTDGSSRLDLDLYARPQQPNHFEFIFVPPVIYLRADLFSPELPVGKQWVKIDLKSVSEELGFDYEGLWGLQARAALAGLESVGDVDRVGRERARGVETTHYRGIVDLERAAESASADVRRSLRELAKQLGTKMLPADVWIDDEGFVRRLRQTYSSRGEPVRTTMTVDFYDFGPALRIEAPPTAQVVDFKATLKGALPSQRAERNARYDLAALIECFAQSEDPTATVQTAGADSFGLRIPPDLREVVILGVTPKGSSGEVGNIVFVVHGKDHPDAERKAQRFRKLTKDLQTPTQPYSRGNVVYYGWETWGGVPLRARQLVERCLAVSRE